MFFLLHASFQRINYPLTRRCMLLPFHPAPALCIKAHVRIVYVAIAYPSPILYDRVSCPITI